MNSRTRLFLSIGIPVLLIIVVVGAFLWQQRAASSGTQSTQHPVSSTFSSQCAALSKTTPPQQLTTMSLALDWTPNTNHTGIYVALNQHWYQAEGINLQLLPYSTNVSPDVLVSSGKANVGISATEGIVSDAAAGQPVVSLAAIIQHNVTLSVDAMQALESHRIDFVWVFEGWEVIQAQRQGVKLNVFPITNYGISDYYTPNIITSPAEIKQKPELLRKFMLATSCGYEYARIHAHEAAQMLIDGTPAGTFPNTGLVFASQDFLSSRYADPGHKWGWQDAAAWHGYPQFMLASNGIQDASGKPVHSMNFDALYTNQFLP